MPHNIFLTGDVRVGKTTIIEEVVRKCGLNPGGFMVGRTGAEGSWTSFYLVEARDYIYSGLNTPFLQNAVFASRPTPDGDWLLKPDVFDQLGVAMLDKGCKERGIVIMDELGRFELRALRFQEKVAEILADQVPVLGVLKQEKNPFLDRVRARNDLQVIQVNEQNRDRLCRIIMEKVRLFVDIS